MAKNIFVFDYKCNDKSNIKMLRYLKRSIHKMLKTQHNVIPNRFRRQDLFIFFTRYTQGVLQCYRYKECISPIQ